MSSEAGGRTYQLEDGTPEETTIKTDSTDEHATPPMGTSSPIYPAEEHPST